MASRTHLSYSIVRPLTAALLQMLAMQTPSPRY